MLYHETHELYATQGLPVSFLIDFSKHAKIYSHWTTIWSKLSGILIFRTRTEENKIALSYREVQQQQQTLSLHPNGEFYIFLYYWQEKKKLLHKIMRYDNKDV